MHTSSIICSSNSLSPSLYFSSSQPFIPFPGKQITSCPNFSFSCKLQSASLHTRTLSCFTSCSTATQETVDTTSSSAPAFVETGYIYGVHGLQGEVRVKTSTDFPDLRFSTPGTRWLKQQVSGNETIQEIELVEGRGSPGQSWIVRFNGINSVEQARELVGSTILVKDEDRPVLEEGEFYTRDLIGMRVVLKESGEPVGTVAKVFNSGASDILHVRLNSSRKIDKNGDSKNMAADSGPLVWVPFVEAIVPTVDLEKGEMMITPPKGLLELNIRSSEKSKKERRELEWKERKKSQRRLIAAKKKLCEMEQQHVFHGFRYGEKDQRSLLANQIVAVNSKLLQQALQSIEIPHTRPNLLQISSVVPRSNTLKVSDNPSYSGSGMLSDPYDKLQGEGSVLTSKGKVAIVLVLKEIEGIGKAPDSNIVNSEGKENAYLLAKTFLDDHLRFVKIEDRSNVPLIFIGPTGAANSLQELFLDHDYFAFDRQKVWFLEEEKLPVVSSSVEEQGKHKILMKSPWEFLQRPVGSGGVISLLSSQDSLLDELSELGVEYIESFTFVKQIMPLHSNAGTFFLKVCKINQEYKNSHTLIGLVDSCKANVGLRLFKDIESEELDLIFSMSFFKKLVKQINKLQFEAVVGCNSFVEKVEKDWTDVIPTAPNSYEFRSSIYCCLSASPADKICVLYPTDYIHW